MKPASPYLGMARRCADCGWAVVDVHYGNAMYPVTGIAGRVSREGCDVRPRRSAFRQREPASGAGPRRAGPPSVLDVAGQRRFGFCWRCLRKLARHLHAYRFRLSEQRARSPAFGGSRFMQRDAVPCAGQIYHAEMGSRSAGFCRRHCPTAIALFALWASSDLQGMRRVLRRRHCAADVRVSAAGLGAAVTAVGVLSEGPHLAKYHSRGPLFVTLAILSSPSRSGRWE